MASVRHKSNPWQAWIAINYFRASSLLSLRGARALGTALAFLGRTFPNKHVTTTRKNVARCLPELSAAEQRQVVRRSLAHTAMTFTELGAVWHWPTPKILALEREVEGEELLDEALRQGRGMLVLVPHIGNWEILNHFLSARFPIHAVYRPPKVIELEKYFCERRQRSGAVLVPATFGGMRTLHRALRDGGAIGILPDQKPPAGVMAPFFGTEVLTIELVAALLRRFPARVLFGYTVRRPGGFDMRIRSAPDGLDDADDVTAATRLNQGIESCIRECPEQYLWSYKRFRTPRRR